MKAFILVQHLANLAHDRRAFVQACADEATSTPDEIERWLIGGAKALSREQQVQVVQASGYSNRTLSGENVHYMRLVEDTKRPLVEHPGYIAMLPKLSKSCLIAVCRQEACRSLVPAALLLHRSSRFSLLQSNLVLLRRFPTEQTRLVRCPDAVVFWRQPKSH